MTTTVTVQAHCNPNEYEVSIEREYEEDGEYTVIQDGETWTGIVYDDWKISVREVQKK